jgi:hypothetical protein
MNKKNSQLKDSKFNQKFQDLKGLKSTDLVEGLKSQKPDSKQLKRGLKKAISRNNWLNYLVLFISIYFFWNTGVAIRHNHKLGAKFDALKLKDGAPARVKQEPRTSKKILFFSRISRKSPQGKL